MIKDSKRKLFIAMALLVFCVLLMAKNFLFNKKNTGHGSQAIAVPIESAPGLSSLRGVLQNEDLWDSQLSEWGRDWGRDPFMPSGAGPLMKGSMSLILSGILWDEKMPIAIVNDQALKNNDTIEGYRVVEITPSSVVLSAGSEKFELHLFEKEQIQ